MLDVSGLDAISNFTQHALIVDAEISHKNFNINTPLL
jgi:hypothetical protein